VLAKFIISIEPFEMNTRHKAQQADAKKKQKQPVGETQMVTSKSDAADSLRQGGASGAKTEKEKQDLMQDCMRIQGENLSEEESKVSALSKRSRSSSLDHSKAIG